VREREREGGSRIYSSIRFRKQAVEANARIELTCFGPDGIDAVVSALRQAKVIGVTAGCPISTTYVSSPEYSLRVTHEDPQFAKALLDKAIQVTSMTRMKDCKLILM